MRISSLENKSLMTVPLEQGNVKHSNRNPVPVD
jgi:hypothetical protein